MKLAEKVELSKFIIEQALAKYPNIFAACSFGKDSRVLVDLGMQVNPGLLFVSIDTGYEFPETLSFAEELAKETKMNLEWARPSANDVEKINNEFGDNLIKDNQYKCCAMKLPAIKKFLNSYDAWISGLRRDEAETRTDTKIIESGESVIKINPIAFWTKNDVWQYIKENNLKYHPLYDQGYVSLGCQPCTLKDVDEKNGERSGRFVGTNRAGLECGLHVK